MLNLCELLINLFWLFICYYIYRCPHNWVLSLQPILQTNLQLQSQNWNDYWPNIGQTIRLPAETNVPSKCGPQNCYQHGPHHAEDIRQRLLQKPSTAERALLLWSDSVHRQQIERDCQWVRFEPRSFQQSFCRGHDQARKIWGSYRNTRRNSNWLHPSQLELWCNF